MPESVARYSTAYGREVPGDIQIPLSLLFRRRSILKLLRRLRCCVCSNCRRDLITSGTLSKNIKIRDNSLYINGTKHGSVINFTYQTCPLVSTTPSRTSVPASTSAGLAASSTVLPATATCLPQPINTPLTSSLDSCHTSIPHPISTSPTSHSDTCQLPNTPIPYLINTSTSKTPILHHNSSPTSNSADLSNK